MPTYSDNHPRFVNRAFMTLDRALVRLLLTNADKRSDRCFS